MDAETLPAVDGRRARRDRSRAAVIDAVFELVHEARVPPAADEVAERSGVSVSSIFRMFDGLDDMRNQAFDQFDRRYAHLVVTEFDASLPRQERIDGLVRSRVELYAASGALLRLGRQRSLDHPNVADRMSALSSVLAQQVQHCLRVETTTLSSAAVGNLVAMVDATTSPDAFDLLQAVHGRSRRQVERTWRRGVGALVAAWCNEPAEPTPISQGVNS
ncbi:MAG: TetR/AcrR family transcriptional regulator [Ilumatobacter sp.]